MDKQSILETVKTLSPVTIVVAGLVWIGSSFMTNLHTEEMKRLELLETGVEAYDLECYMDEEVDCVKPTVEPEEVTDGPS